MKYTISLLILLICNTSFAAVSYSEFLVLKDAIYKGFEDIKTSEDALSINTVYEGMSPTIWWDTPMVHASYVYTDFESIPTHNIYLMGGFVKQIFMTPDGLALTACHEIGHGIGGAPFKLSEDPTQEFGASTEGQSDYFSTNNCLAHVFKYLPKMRDIPKNEYHIKLCKLQDKHDLDLCLRMMNALNAKMDYLNSILQNGQRPVSLYEFSQNIQKIINLSPRYYPDPQCRLDTQINGVLGLARPECWYPGGEKNGALR